MKLALNTTVVDTVALDDLTARVHASIWRLEHALHNASAISFSSTSMHLAFSRSVHCARRLRELADKTAVCSEQYAQREAVVRGASEELSSILLWNLGRAMPAFVMAYGPAIIGGVAIVLTLAAARRIAPGSAYDQFLTQMEGRLPDQGQIMSNPLMVRAVGLGVNGADDFVAGVLGLPMPAKQGMFGGEDLVAATAIAGLGVAGQAMLQETPIRVKEASRSEATAPTGYHELISRIPRADEGAAQIRIEKYETGYVVYLGGTIDAGVQPGTEPWDMTSNVTAIAELDAGSYRAAVLAMKEAGITAEDNVILVGHSQGGLVAAQLAASGDYQVSDVVTVGAPLHQVEIPESVHVIAVEHAEDVIPSLSGVAAGAAVAGHVTVTRSLYAGGTAPRGDVLPAHNLSRYVETGAVMDRSGDPQLTEEQRRLSSNMRGNATVTTWRGDRVQK